MSKFVMESMLSKVQLYKCDLHDIMSNFLFPSRSHSNAQGFFLLIYEIFINNSHNLTYILENPANSYIKP